MMCSSTSGRRAFSVAGLLAVMALASCSEVEAPTRPDEGGDTVGAPLGGIPGSITCSIDVAARSLDCPEMGAGAFAMVSAADGSSERLVGGQGLYVRLASASPAYDEGTTSFTVNVTVQNLTSSLMATADGATGHADGVRVFFPSTPIATSGTGTISVTGDGNDTFLADGQPYYQYGGSVDDALGGDDILAPGETSSARQWTFNVPETVGTFTFQAFIATEMVEGALATIAPQVTAVSATMVPFSTVTLTGTNFDVTPANNIVRIDGVTATVTSATETTLDVVVPCIAQGAAGVQVTRNGMTGVAFDGTAGAVNGLDLGVGETAIVSSLEGIRCTELQAAGAEAEYVISVFSRSTSPASNTPFAITGAAGNAPLPFVTADDAGLIRPSGAAPSSGLEGLGDDMHTRILEQNRQIYNQNRHLLRRDLSASRANIDPVEPPLTRTFRVANISPPAGQTFCSSFYVISATRVYYDGSLAIYEDDATPVAFRAGANPAMAANYQKIGDQFNDDMLPVITENFGDPLLRDDETDNNDVLVALFTPRINNSFPGVAGFVVSCDQFPNNDTNPEPAVGGPYTGSAGSGFASSNHGEFFYAYQPVTDATGYSGNTPDNWYRTIRSTFIHETKHVASQAARVVNNASFEESWLEEGTARHSEELWGRAAVYPASWKTNIGYGSFANPSNMYCDARPGFAECSANPRAPAAVMQRHFQSLYTLMFGQNARLLSPFGATASDNASYWYATSWSLVRYAIDRTATTEAAFLTALTQSTTTGITNLLDRSGLTLDDLLGSWSLSFALDDRPDITVPATTQFATWDLRNIYAGMNTDFPGTYTLVHPMVPTAFSFGAFTAPQITTLRGGGFIMYRVSGTQSASQLLQMTGVPSSNLRMAIARVK